MVRDDGNASENILARANKQTIRPKWRAKNAEFTDKNKAMDGCIANRCYIRIWPKQRIVPKTMPTKTMPKALPTTLPSNASLPDRSLLPSMANTCIECCI